VAIYSALVVISCKFLSECLPITAPSVQKSRVKFEISVHKKTVCVCGWVGGCYCIVFKLMLPFRPKFVVENNTIYCVLTGFIVLKFYLFTYNNFLMKVISGDLSVSTSVCLVVYLSIPQLTHPLICGSYTYRTRIVNKT
jgi:hypothetical protein